MAGAAAGGRALERALALARAELAGLPARDVDLFAARLARW
ncbi:MAG TPA: hypothetical protein VKP11_00470 [Frankiaceae bacterium]|nr:hypothetical protein [Frankiaceae bacterium]